MNHPTPVIISVSDVHAATGTPVTSLSPTSGGKEVARQVQAHLDYMMASSMLLSRMPRLKMYDYCADQVRNLLIGGTDNLWTLTDQITSYEIRPMVSPSGAAVRKVGGLPRMQVQFFNAKGDVMLVRLALDTRLLRSWAANLARSGVRFVVPHPRYHVQGPLFTALSYVPNWQELVHVVAADSSVLPTIVENDIAYGWMVGLGEWRATCACPSLAQI